MIWEEDIDRSLVVGNLNKIDIIRTFLSTNYIIEDSFVVKLPQRVDDNTNLILNMIYERQIKRFS